MNTRRSTGKMHVARAIWYAKEGVVELRPVRLAPLQPGLARIRTLFSGISRGTERLILNGSVAQSEWSRMRGPNQEGDFPFPVKYGYCATGIVEEGPAALLGKTVFCLHPHQDLFDAPPDQLAVVPSEIPARRATLTANMETALNALWDSGAGPGDRIVVVGAGVVGLLVASLAARLPGAQVTSVDVNTARRPVAEALGAHFASPDAAPRDADVVFHASASSQGLNTAIKCAGHEGTIVELSWYGDKPVTVDLGDAFHSGRLKLISSQVGHISPSRRPRWDYPRRRAAAVSLLGEVALDRLVSEEIAFEHAQQELPRVLTSSEGLAPIIRYPSP